MNSDEIESQIHISLPVFRDWTGVFSPPIVLPGDMGQDSDRTSDDSSHHGTCLPSVYLNPKNILGQISSLRPVTQSCRVIRRDFK